MLSSLAESGKTGFVLPQYTKALPSHLDQDDIRYLAKKGALSVPATGLRNKLMTSYAHHVHSDLPLLNLDNLVRPILQNDANDAISLLLLQALFFAAVTFVDIEDLQAAGFESRPHAQRTFFQRARLLYDFDYEQDRMTLVQALLLMSYWEEMPNGRKDGWHWLGLAFSVAQTIGLHRKTESGDEDTTRIRTRLWWCICTRDCLMTLDMRHSMLISNLESNTQELTIDHFELQLSEVTVSSIGYSGLLGNAEHQRSLAVIFIEKVRLCHHIKTVMEFQYSIQVDFFARVVPNKMMQEGNEVLKYAQDLHRWELTLAPEARWVSSALTYLTKAESILHVQRSSLKMIYLSLMGALYRPHLQSNLSTCSEAHVLPRQQLFCAADQITKIVRNLDCLKLTSLLPAAAVTALYSAGITYLYGLQDISERDGNSQQLSMCLYYLAGLGELYSTAGPAASFLEAVIGKVMPYRLEKPDSPEDWNNFTGSSRYRNVSMASQQSLCSRSSQSGSAKAPGKWCSTNLSRAPIRHTSHAVDFALDSWLQVCKAASIKGVGRPA